MMMIMVMIKEKKKKNPTRHRTFKFCPSKCFFPPNL